MSSRFGVSGSFFVTAFDAVFLGSAFFRAFFSGSFTFMNVPPQVD
jgi:hypothetical protein